MPAELASREFTHFLHDAAKDSTNHIVGLQTNRELWGGAGYRTGGETGLGVGRPGVKHQNSLTAQFTIERTVCGAHCGLPRRSMQRSMRRSMRPSPRRADPSLSRRQQGHHRRLRRGDLTAPQRRSVRTAVPVGQLGDWREEDEHRPAVASQTATPNHRLRQSWQRKHLLNARLICTPMLS